MILEKGREYFDTFQGGDCGLREPLGRYEAGVFWRERRCWPLLAAAYTAARSARFGQGGWLQ